MPNQFQGSPMEEEAYKPPCENSEKIFSRSIKVSSTICESENIHKTSSLVINDEIVTSQVYKAFSSEDNFNSLVPSAIFDKSDQCASSLQSGQSTSPLQSGENASILWSVQRDSKTHPGISNVRGPLYSSCEHMYSALLGHNSSTSLHSVKNSVTVVGDVATLMRPINAATLAGTRDAATLAGPSDAETLAGLSDAATLAGLSDAATLVGPSEAMTLTGPSYAARGLNRRELQTLLCKTDVQTQPSHNDSLTQLSRNDAPTQPSQNDAPTSPHGRIHFDHRRGIETHRKVAPRVPVDCSQCISFDCYALPQQKSYVLPSNCPGKISEMVYNMYPELSDPFGIVDIPYGILMHSYDRLRHFWEKKSKEMNRQQNRNRSRAYFNELLTDEVKFLYSVGWVRNLELAGRRDPYLMLHTVKAKDTAKLLQAALVTGYTMFALTTNLVYGRVKALKKLQHAVTERKEKYCDSCKGSDEEQNTYDKEVKEREDLIRQSHTELLQFRHDLHEGLEALTSMENCSRYYEGFRF